MLRIRTRSFFTVSKSCSLLGLVSRRTVLYYRFNSELLCDVKSWSRALSLMASEFCLCCLQMKWSCPPHQTVTCSSCPGSLQSSVKRQGWGSVPLNLKYLWVLLTNLEKKEHEIDRLIVSALALMQTLNKSFVVKREAWRTLGALEEKKKIGMQQHALPQWKGTIKVFDKDKIHKPTTL